MKSPGPFMSYIQVYLEDLSRVVATCMEKDPDHRYESMDSLLADLDLILAGEEPRPSKKPHGMPKRAQTIRRPWMLASVGGLVVVMTIILFMILWRYSVRKKKLGLVVLPFDNKLSDTAANQALADGLMQSVTGTIARMEVLKDSLWLVPAEVVASENISTANEARKRFAVNRVVTGVVQQLGDDVQLIVNLIDPSGGELELLSSEIITAPLGPEFQQETLRALGRLLGVRFDAQERQIAQASRPVSPGAFAFYVRGQGFLRRFDQAGNIDNAIAMFNQALGEDSLYALAYAGVCEATWRKYEIENNTSLAEEAVGYCDKAEALAVEEAPVLVTLGSIYMETGALRKAERTLLRAKEIEPRNADVYRWLGRVYESLSLFDDAEEAYQEAIALKTAILVCLFAVWGDAILHRAV